MEVKEVTKPISATDSQLPVGTPESTVRDLNSKDPKHAAALVRVARDNMRAARDAVVDLSGPSSTRPPRP